MALYDPIDPDFVNNFSTGYAPNISAQDPGPLGLDPSDSGPQATSLSKIKQPGFFGRLKQKPGAADALIAFGTGLLSHPDFFQGLGAGATAFNATLNSEADKLKPQMLKDGTFTYSIDPTTGQPVFKRTAVADYEDSITNRKLATSENNARYNADRRYDGTVYSVDQRDRDSSRHWDYQDRYLDHQDDWNRDRNNTNLEIARLNQAGRERIAAAQRAGRQVPVGAVKEYDDYAGKVSAANATLDLGNSVLTSLQNGTLNLGLVSNLLNTGKAVSGVFADEGSRAYGALQQFTQELVNTKLMDARGVQTDGDAERAKIMSMVSSGDNEGAAHELANAMRMLERSRNYHQARAADISNQYGIDVSNTAPTVSGGPTTAAPSPRGGRSSLKQKYGLE